MTTRLAPFFANHGYHPDMHVKLPTEASLPERTADERLGKLQADRDRPRESILEAQARKTKYAVGKEMFEDGDKAWLAHTRRGQTKKPCSQTMRRGQTAGPDGRCKEMGFPY
jgi:hypothetical protein